jgi:CheY-like chemotaxis protein
MRIIFPSRREPRRLTDGFLDLNPATMTSTRTLVLVEDDTDDQEMIKMIFADLGFDHDIKVFRDGEAALKFLYESAVNPFLIISDINMPRMDGLTFKDKIESCAILKEKSIPFVFLSTASTRSYIQRAYALRAQGFFEKGSTYTELKESISAIIKYWRRSKNPN